ncbi:MAG: hypothetical protein PHE93_01025 [Clostridia bacterium]|nr:hypothetical protein [Clostridia bacterium]
MAIIALHMYQFDMLVQRITEVSTDTLVKYKFFLVDILMNDIISVDVLSNNIIDVLSNDIIK